MKTVLQSLLQSTAVAMAYCTLAQFSHLADVTPLNVSMLWLPAGLALVAAMYWGAYAFPGIFLGAFINNWLNLEQLTMVALFTALGTALQPPVIAKLMGRFVHLGFYGARCSAMDSRNPFTLTVRSLAVISVGSLIAPSAGALTLCASGVNYWNNFVKIWLHWWIGDFIGILMIAPLAWHALELCLKRRGFGSWLIPIAFNVAALGIFFFLLHESIEGNKQLSLQKGQLLDTLLFQHIISVSLLAVFLGLAAVLVALAYQQWHKDRNLHFIQKELRNQLNHEKTLIESLPQHIWTATADGLLDYVSPQACNFFAKTEKELIANGWNSVVHPDDLPEVILRWQESVVNCVPYRINFRLRRSDGTFIPFVGAAMPVRDSAGEITRWFGSNTDISDQMALIEQLRESQKLEAIGQLTGGLAHDFNNLLGIVVGNLDEIGERLPQNDPQLRQQHRTALNSALRGAEVTRSLLAVARRQPLAVSNHDLNALVDEIVPLARSSAGTSVTVRADLAAGQLHARIDAAGLSNVILNLVINARDAMQDCPGPHEITLRTRKMHCASGTDETLAPGWYAVLEVTDNGAGMAEHIRAQAFEPFFTTKQRGDGTGLGLAMVYGYATQLGGTARIQSEEGRGTTVQLYLPMSAQAGDAKEAQTTPASTAAAEPSPAPLDAPRAQRVLVVDDEQALCELACDWLESMGYQTTGVFSAAAALERLATEPFDILFTDIVMPGGIDGMALARQAQLRYPHLRIMLTSGYAKGLSGEEHLPGKLVNKPYRKKDLILAFHA